WRGALDGLLPQEQEGTRLDLADAPSGQGAGPNLGWDARGCSVDQKLPGMTVVRWESKGHRLFVRIENDQQGVVDDRPAERVRLASRLRAWRCRASLMAASSVAPSTPKLMLALSSVPSRLRSPFGSLCLCS